MTEVSGSFPKTEIPTEQADKPADPVRKFRAELVRIMPGYEWTVHRQHRPIPELLEATGIQSSGFNRLSTLSVARRNKDGRVEYTVRSAGYGTRAPWLHTNADVTLASALRGLQAHYETAAAKYGGHARALQNARKVPVSGDADPSTAGTEQAERREVSSEPTS